MPAPDRSATRSPPPTPSPAAPLGLGPEQLDEARQEAPFTARIAVPDARLLVDDKSLPLSLGILASVDIEADSRKLMEYIRSRVMRATSEAGRER